MDIVEELLCLINALDAASVNYAVCGGLAVTIHGRPRLTINIDLVVPKSTMERAVQTAAAIGFDVPTGWVSFPDETLGTGRMYRLTKIKDNDFLTLDLLEVDTEDNPIWLDQRKLELDGQVVCVLSKSALIKMKAGSDRTKDRLDIELLTDETS